MEDERIWAFEASLWTAGALHYQKSIDECCVMVLPANPYVLSGSAAIEAVTHSPRWSEVALTERQVQRPQEGLIVVAYHARATREGEAYEAWCTSTYRRLAHEEWRVVQHQQTPPLALSEKV